MAVGAGLTGGGGGARRPDPRGHSPHQGTHEGHPANVAELVVISGKGSFSPTQYGICLWNPDTLDSPSDPASGIPETCRSRAWLPSRRESGRLPGLQRIRPRMRNVSTTHHCGFVMMLITYSSQQHGEKPDFQLSVFRAEGLSGFPLALLRAPSGSAAAGLHFRGTGEPPTREADFFSFSFWYREPEGGTLLWETPSSQSCKALGQGCFG